MVNKSFIVCVFCFAVSALLLFGCAKTSNEIVLDYSADKSLSVVKDRGKIIMGIDPDFPPMRLIDESGNLVGYDVDVAKEIAAGMGVSIDIKQISWGELFDNVKSGNVDVVISAITITPARLEELLFSIPYLDAGQVIIVKKDNTDINKPEDLKGKKIGVLSGTTCEQSALQYADPSSVFGYESNQDILSDVEKGTLDLMVTDLIGASGFVKNNPGLKIAGDPFTQEYYGAATKLENIALMDEINKALREMKRNGKLDDLKTKWLK